MYLVLNFLQMLLVGKIVTPPFWEITKQGDGNTTFEKKIPSNPSIFIKQNKQNRRQALLSLRHLIYHDLEFPKQIQ